MLRHKLIWPHPQDIRQLGIGNEQEVGNTRQEVLDASPGVTMHPIQFIEPMGFTTMWDAPLEEPNLFRLRPPSNTEVFLVEGATSFQEHGDLPGVTTGIRSDAKLFRGNMRT